MAGVLGAQLQESELQPKLTVREALELYASFYPTPPTGAPLAERLGLTAKLTTRFAKLSGGQKQRLFIALALIGNPRVVVLDELTTGLDPRARRDTWQLIEDVRARRGDRPAGHPLHGGGPAAVRPDRRDRQGPGGRAGHPGGSHPALGGLHRHLLHPVRAAGRRDLDALPGARLRRAQGRPGHPPGTDETVNAVITLLARHHITAHQLRVSDATLDDAFLDLTEAAA